mmetsp:Transcript_19673/g.60856  ORF Transcript_19673/g.60856 Transcript_19673/m.60856 type:complete len:271 (-) Transcript_19673:1794-2606(-)
MEAHGQQPRLDLHELAVHEADDLISCVERHVLGVEVRRFLFEEGVLRVQGRVQRRVLRDEEGHVLVDVAREGGGDDGVDDGRASRVGFSETLVRRDEVRELLEALVEPGVLCRRRQVGNRRRVGAPLRNRRFGGIVGGVVIQIRDRPGEAVGVARRGHADLFPRHELQAAVRAEMQDRVGLEDLLQVRVVRGEAVVRARALGEQKSHGIALVAEGRLHADEDVAEFGAEHQQVLAVRVQLARRGAPVLVQFLGVGRLVVVFAEGHAVRDV